MAGVRGGQSAGDEEARESAVTPDASAEPGSAAAAEAAPTDETLGEEDAAETAGTAGSGEGDDEAVGTHETGTDEAPAEEPSAEEPSAEKAPAEKAPAEEAAGAPEAETSAGALVRRQDAPVARRPAAAVARPVLPEVPDVPDVPDVPEVLRPREARGDWKAPADPRAPETIGIIGAGPSGLAMAATLKAAGLPFEVLERHSDVGGIWDIDNPGSAMYTTAHLISSRTQSALDGFPFPDSYPDYPSRRQVLDYLRAYTDKHGLRRRIRFGDAVRHVERLPNGGWRVLCASGTERRYRALVLATGLLWEPNRPAFPGTFTGESIHAKYYRSPDQLRGKRVLVVGGGNSGVDIACDAAAHAQFAAISLRRGYHFIPKHVFGIPADVFAHRGPHLPARVEQLAFGALLRLLVGDLRRYGLRKPDHRVLSSHPILNTQILHYLSHGDVHVRPDVAELAGDMVRFVDDTKEEYDLVIYATGYRPHLPYLDPDELKWHGPRPQLFLNVFHPVYPDLFVLGLFETDGAAYPVISLQARLVARVLLDQYDNPDQANAFRKLAKTDPVLHGGRRYLDTPRHSTYIQNRAYRKYASRLLKRMERGRLREG